MISLSRYDGDTCKVYLYVEERARSADVKIGLTLLEMSRACDLGPNKVSTCLGILINDGLITSQKKSKYELLTIVSDERGLRPVPFSRTMVEEKRMAALEAEVRRLAETLRTQRTPLKSDLQFKCRGETRALVIEMERDLGRGLTQFESLTLGNLIGGYGLARVRALYRKHATSDNPLDTISAIMYNGGSGAAFKERETTESKIGYREL